VADGALLGRKIYFSLKHACLFTAGKFYNVWNSLIAFIFLPLWYCGVMNRNRIWMILKLFWEDLEMVFGTLVGIKANIVWKA
jgi:hypothetical protein